MNGFFYTINGLAGENPLVDALGLFFAEYLVFVILALSLFVLRKEIKIFLFAFAAAVLARFGFVELIRHLFPTDRPFVGEEVNLITANLPFLDPTVQSSFPSGHTSFVFAFSFTILFFHRRAGLVLLFLSLLVGVSRVFVGVHWPADIAGGIVVGGVSALLVFLLLHKEPV